MGLQDKLTAMKRETIATKPPEVVGTMLEETKKLVQSGIDKNAIKVGEVLPAFSLSDSSGHLINSKELLANGPLIVSFYRGVW